MSAHISPLLKLPSELRQLIFSYGLTCPYADLKLSNGGHLFKPSQDFFYHEYLHYRYVFGGIGLFRCNHKIRAEALQVFTKSNYFVGITRPASKAQVCREEFPLIPTAVVNPTFRGCIFNYCQALIDIRCDTSKFRTLLSAGERETYTCVISITLLPQYLSWFQIRFDPFSSSFPMPPFKMTISTRESFLTAYGIGLGTDLESSYLPIARLCSQFLRQDCCSVQINKCREGSSFLGCTNGADLTAYGISTLEQEVSRKRLVDAYCRTGDLFARHYYHFISQRLLQLMQKLGERRSPPIEAIRDQAIATAGTCIYSIAALELYFRPAKTLFTAALPESGPCWDELCPCNLAGDFLHLQASLNSKPWIWYRIKHMELISHCFSPNVSQLRSLQHSLVELQRQEGVRDPYIHSDIHTLAKATQTTRRRVYQSCLSRAQFRKVWKQISHSRRSLPAFFEDMIYFPSSAQVSKLSGFHVEV